MHTSFTLFPSFRTWSTPQSCCRRGQPQGRTSVTSAAASCSSCRAAGTPRPSPVQIPPCTHRALEPERQRLGHGRRRRRRRRLGLGLGLGLGQRHRCVGSAFCRTCVPRTGSVIRTYVAEVGHDEAALSDEQIAGEQVLPSTRPPANICHAARECAGLRVCGAADVPKLRHGQREHGVQLTRERRVIAVVGRHALHLRQVSPVVTLLRGHGPVDLTRSVWGGRWYQGTVHYERKWKSRDSPEGQEARAQIERIKKNRNWGQPYVRSVQVLCSSEILALNIVVAASRRCSSLGMCALPARPLHEWMVCSSARMSLGGNELTGISRTQGGVRE